MLSEIPIPPLLLTPHQSIMRLPNEGYARRFPVQFSGSRWKVTVIRWFVGAACLDGIDDWLSAFNWDRGPDGTISRGISTQYSVLTAQGRWVHGRGEGG